MLLGSARWNIVQTQSVPANARCGRSKASGTPWGTALLHYSMTLCFPARCLYACAFAWRGVGEQAEQNQALITSLLSVYELFVVVLLQVHETAIEEQTSNSPVAAGRKGFGSFCSYWECISPCIWYSGGVWMEEVLCGVVWLKDCLMVSLRSHSSFHSLGRITLGTLPVSTGLLRPSSWVSAVEEKCGCFFDYYYFFLNGIVPPDPRLLGSAGSRR